MLRISMLLGMLLICYAPPLLSFDKRMAPSKQDMQTPGNPNRSQRVHLLLSLVGENPAWKVESWEPEEFENVPEITSSPNNVELGACCWLKLACCGVTFAVCVCCHKLCCCCSKKDCCDE